MVVVEKQHGTNHYMSEVSASILMYIKMAHPDAIICLKSGSNKLKLCESIGITREYVAGLKKAKSKSKSKQQKRYAENKQMTVCAIERLGIDVTASRCKRDDICDAVMQGLWALWDLSKPKLLTHHVKEKPEPKNKQKRLKVA